MNPRIQARIAQNQWKKRQELLRSARTGFVRGALLASKMGAKMLQEGWIDGKTFEKELLHRMKVVVRRSAMD